MKTNYDGKLDTNNYHTGINIHNIEHNNIKREYVKCLLRNIPCQRDFVTSLTKVILEVRLV